MKFIASSTARRSTRRASSGSWGSPQTPGPVIRMAPKPSLWTGRSPPMANVPVAAALIVARVLIQPNRLGCPLKVSGFSPCYKVLLRHLQRHRTLHRDNIILTHRTDQQMRRPRLEPVVIDQPVRHVGGG